MYIHTHNQWVPGVKQPEHEVDCSLLTIAEVRNEWGSAFMPPVHRHGKVFEYIENFDLLFLYIHFNLLFLYIYIFYCKPVSVM